MANDLVKRFIKKDGSQRISFYRDEYAINPRYETDFPLHCEDWSRDCSIMTKDEIENKSSNAAALLRYLLQRHGDNKKIIKALKDNYKSEKHDAYDNALSYDRSRKEWILWSWHPSWKDYQGNGYESHWSEEWSLCTNIYDVDIYNIADYLSDETIEYFANKYMMDGIKIMSYGFGYYGGISFYRDFSTDSEGIAWLEKDEALKYWIKEEYWEKEDCYDLCEGIRNELEAWAEGEVYGFVVEDAVRIQGIKTYYNGEREDEPYIDTQWETSDSCWGYYGDIDEVTIPMFDGADLDINEFEEVEI